MRKIVKIILLILLNICSESNAIDVVGQAYQWNKKHTKLILVPVNLRNLNEAKKLESPILKIVLGSSADPISIDKSDISLRAQNVFYHATLALEWFQEFRHTKNHSLHKPLIIRLDMAQGFSENSHWSEAEDLEKHNSALTVPASTSLRYDEVQPWDAEIWFRPKKILKVPSQFTRSLKMYIHQGYRVSLYSAIAATSALRAARMYAFSGDLASSLTINGVDGAVTLIAVEALVHGSYKVSKLFKTKKYRESSAYPEIIYHEVAHFALSDRLDISQDSPMVEALANYFASEISGSENIAKPTKKFSSGSASHLGSSRMPEYHPKFEHPDFAQASYGFQMLWQVARVLGRERTYVFRELLDQGLISADSNFYKDLPIALSAAAKGHKREDVLKLKLNRFFADAFRNRLDD